MRNIKFRAWDKESAVEVVGNIHQNPELLIDRDLLPIKEI